MKIPLFPLGTVLYPGGPLPLRIFETRYLDMISACLKDESLFGVLLIKSGSETGTATTYDVGTLAHIADWYQGSDGLLGVTAVGRERFRLLKSSCQADGLNVGEIELLAPEPVIILPDEFKSLAHILEGVLDDLGKLYESIAKDYDDAGWVAYRFAEILPMTPQQRQSCLETDDPLQRLRILRDVLKTANEADNA